MRQHAISRTRTVSMAWRPRWETLHRSRQELISATCKDAYTRPSKRLLQKGHSGSNNTHHRDVHRLPHHPPSAHNCHTIHKHASANQAGDR